MAEEILVSELLEATGGLIVNDNVLGRTKGESLDLINYEPGLVGGYRRINGFGKYSSTELSGTGKVLGVAVYNSGVVAARLNTLYFGTGTTWATVATRTSAGKYQFDKYNWTGTQNLLIADGVNPGAKYDGVTYTLLNQTNAGTKPTQVLEHAKHIVMDSDGRHSIIISAPYDETDNSPANGAVEIGLGDTFVKAVSWREQLIIFCKSKILRLTGTSKADWDLKEITDNIGCLSAWSVQEAGGDILFLAPDGIRTISGTDKIDDFEIGVLSRDIHPITDGILDSSTSADISTVVIREKSQYRLFYPTSGLGETLCKGILGGIRKNRQKEIGWEWFELLGIKPNVCDSEYVGDDELIVHGGYDDGFVYKQEFGNDFNGSSVKATYRTPDYDLGDIGIRKGVHRVKVFYRLEGTASLTLNLFYDFNDDDVSQPDPYTLVNSGAAAIYGSTFVYGSTTYGADFEPTTRQSVEGSGFTVALNISTNDTNPPYTIEGFLIEYAVMDRR